MAVLTHALLGLSVVALVAASLRLASLVAPGGLPRALAVAVFATAAAVGEAILLGLVGLGGSSVALTLAAIATAAAALAWLPRPELSAAGELAAWWGRRGLAERVLLGGIGGAALAWAAWQLRHPALGFDTIHYHLPEIVIFVQGGHPGSVQDVLPGLPVGNYPLTSEVSLGWAMGIARSFVPLVVWPWLTLALTAAAGWAGLRSLGTGRCAAGLGVAALCTNPWLLAWQSNGSVTDGPALAWLVTCAALVAISRERTLLLAPAVVAGGLSIGCKTTALPFVLVLLAIGLWRACRRLPGMALVGATVAAALVGGLWYLRNLFDHGSPFWPIVATPWGDPVPASVRSVHTSFIDRPGPTIDLLHHAYLSRFGGGLLLLAAAVLVPLAVRRRRVALAALATAVGLLVWARSPVTGIAPSQSLPETVFSTTRYALPVVAAACVTLALAATDARRRIVRVAPLTLLAAACVVNLVQTFKLHYPVAPSAFTPLAGAAIGAVLAALPLKLRGRPRLLAAAAVVAAALLAIPAAGFVQRHGDTDSSVVSSVISWMAADPAYQDGDAPVATTPAFIGALAGDGLEHRLVAIPGASGCRAIAARARRQWLVVYGGPLGGVARAALTGCLPPPAFHNGPLAVYRPPRG